MDKIPNLASLGSSLREIDIMQEQMMLDQNPADGGVNQSAGAARQGTPAGTTLPASAQAPPPGTGLSSGEQVLEALPALPSTPYSANEEKSTAEEMPDLKVKDSGGVSMEADSYEGSASYTSDERDGEGKRKRTKRGGRRSLAQDRVTLSKDNPREPFLWDGHIPPRPLPEHHVSTNEWKKISVSQVSGFLPFNVPFHLA